MKKQNISAIEAVVKNSTLKRMKLIDIIGKEKLIQAEEKLNEYKNSISNKKIFTNDPDIKVLRNIINNKTILETIQFKVDKKVSQAKISNQKSQTNYYY